MTAVEVAYTMSGSGPPLYMIHGIGSRKSTWEAMTAELSPHFTCVAIDLRGHGDSPIPETPYTLHELVEDVEALRLKLGHDKIHVIGHSLGGMIGPGYALAHPDHTLTVTLLSTAAGRTAEDAGRVKAVVKRMQDKGVDQVLPALVARWYTDEFAAANPDAIEHRIAQVVGTPEQVFLAVFHVYADTEMAPWLSDVRHPCLVLTGEFDPGCPPRLNEFIHNELQDSELVILDGLRHSILVEAPDRVNAPVKDFLLRHT